jgi:integrase
LAALLTFFGGHSAIDSTCEAAAARFVDDHLPHCACWWPTRTDRRDAASSIGHLLLVLRTLGVAAARPVSATPIDEELRRFDEYMDHVRGREPRTRRAMLRIVRELLWVDFGVAPYAIVRCAADLGLRSGEIAALTLDDIDWRDGTLTLPYRRAAPQNLNQ